MCVSELKFAFSVLAVERITLKSEKKSRVVCYMPVEYERKKRTV